MDNHLCAEFLYWINKTGLSSLWRLCPVSPRSCSLAAEPGTVCIRWPTGYFSSNSSGRVARGHKWENHKKYFIHKILSSFNQKSEKSCASLQKSVRPSPQSLLWLCSSDMPALMCCGSLSDGVDIIG